MKRIWVSIVLFVLLIVTCCLGASAAQSNTDHIIASIEAVKEKMLQGDEEGAYRGSLDLLERWEKSHKVLCLYMPHSRLETVGETLSILPALCQMEDKAQFQDVYKRQ